MNLLQSNELKVRIDSLWTTMNKYLHSWALTSSNGHWYYSHTHLSLKYWSSQNQTACASPGYKQNWGKRFFRSSTNLAVTATRSKFLEFYIIDISLKRLTRNGHKEGKGIHRYPWSRFCIPLGIPSRNHLFSSLQTHKLFKNWISFSRVPHFPFCSYVLTLIIRPISAPHILNSESPEDWVGRGVSWSLIWAEAWHCLDSNTCICWLLYTCLVIWWSMM